MVFIKGAWLEPHHDIFEEEDRWNNYFCCPKSMGLILTAHMEEYNPATGKGEKHDPPQWVTCHCGLTHDEREILFTEDDYRHHAFIRPNWCPLRGESR